MSEKSSAQSVSLAQMQMPKSNDTITLIEALAILWRRRYLIALFVVVGCLMGIFAGLWIRPQFSSDVLLQVNTKGTSSKATKAMGEMGALLDMASPADAEIELIKSRMVLSPVVEAEHLEFLAAPKSNFFDRLLHREGRMDLDFLNIPKVARTERWMAEVIDSVTFAVVDPEGNRLLKGNVGELHSVNYANESFSIRVNLMRARPGQKFVLRQVPALIAERNLASGLKVAEKGKQTGIISVRFSHRYPDRASSVLNTIARTYLRQNVEMRSAEAAKTLGFLEAQLPGVKAKLDTAEKILADYRHSIGSVDMTGETRAHLEKEMDLQKQILQLEQQRQQATRLFKEEHPSVVTIVKQQNNLRSELYQLKKNAEAMPLTQQEVMRLQEEVAVNNEVYTTMLNNIQQLRVVRAGEVGNVRIVDLAQVELLPTKPKKLNILICFVAASFMLGVLLVFLLRMMRNGVRSSIEIERETEMSVLAKIPQSTHRLLRGHRALHHDKPFVVQEPDDVVSEAFRSLLTGLNFSIPQDGHKVYMVTGLIPEVGKSFVSLNLAALMAENGQKVLLIDGDMRRGVVHGTLDKGLAEVLGGMATLETSISEYKINNLFVMNAGRIKTAACELLRGSAMAKLVEEARAKFDVVIVDTPPLSLVTDAELIYPLVDFSLFVLHYGKHSMDEIRESVRRIKLYADKPCAFVMNHCEHEPGHYGYGYGYYGKNGYRRHPRKY